MNKTTFSELLEKMPLEYLEATHKFTVGLIKIYTDKGESEKHVHIGSGTLVTIEAKSGILTARHVTDELINASQLGIEISENDHSYRIDKDHINIINLEKAEEDESHGPDMSFIVLSSYDISNIQSILSFFSLTSCRSLLLESPPDENEGVWFASGVPAILTTNEDSLFDFQSILVFEHFSGVGFIDPSYFRRGFDYTMIQIDCSSLPNPSRSLGGMSGGGLWQILIHLSPDGKNIEAISPILSGVIFYQTVLENDQRKLRCHFRHSLYRILYDKVISS